MDGKLQFVSFNAQHFDADAANPYTPAAYSWPSTFPEHEEYLTAEIQRLLTLLRMRTSVFNIETRVASNGKPYIMECTPRGGGNRLGEMLRYATGVDLITAQVRAAVGDCVEGIEQRPYNGYWAEVILHADKDGIFQALHVDAHFRNNVVDTDLWVQAGDEVKAFNGANDAIGTLKMRFDKEEDMIELVRNIRQFIMIQLSDK